MARRRERIIDGILVALVFMVCGYAIYARLPRTNRVSADEWRSLLRGRVVDEGTAGSPVLVEFADYQCPFCARAESTVFAVGGDSALGIRRVVRHFPLPYHRAAMAAASTAECVARQTGDFAMIHHMLYAARDSLESIDWAILAKEAGVGDTAAFRACTASTEIRDYIERDIQLGRSVGVTGTPAYYLRGRALAPMAESDLRALLRREMRSWARPRWWVLNH